MKIRNGFVSNSSSSSFVIKLYDVTPKQIKQIVNHIAVAKKMGMKTFYSPIWNVDVLEQEIKGETFMDNFDMKEFLNLIGVPENVIIWGD